METLRNDAQRFDNFGAIMKITRKRRQKAMLEQGMHSGNTDAKFDPPPKPVRHLKGCPSGDFGPCDCPQETSHD